MAEKIPVKSLLLGCCRFVLGGTFAYAAVHKIADPTGFVTDVGHYHLLPYAFTVAIGVYLPWLELLCGISVLFRWRERGALILIGGMSAVFCLALASAWFRGLDINCGCFGQNTDPTNLSWAIARSLSLGLVAQLLLKTTTQTSRSMAH